MTAWTHGTLFVSALAGIFSLLSIHTRYSEASLEVLQQISVSVRE